ncbi:AraC family transcriptional regulator [Cytophagales bacterium RKSG123]|nr:AraC family transcriptional regulator [Xanthovirga aplysinae]
MVCPRCVRVVREDLEKLGVQVKHVELGLAEVTYDEREISLAQIAQVLEKNGFALLEDKDQQLIEQIKTELIQLVDQLEEKEHVNTSEYLSRQLGVNYPQLSRLFSHHEGLTIEKYLIQLKIMKVKEYLKYDQLSIKEIAYKLDYSSTAHLSRQFKDHTGMTLSDFKKENAI